MNLNSKPVLTGSMAAKLKRNGLLLEKFIGKGAFGNVYTCRKNFGKKKYAAKVVEFGDDNMIKWQTENEIEILKEVCHHGNIVNLHGVVRDNNNIMMILEFIPAAQFLEGILNWPRFNENDVKKIAMQLLDALRYCHSKRIIHRDVSPENILWYDVPTAKRPHATPVLKLIDFNLSRKMPDHVSYLRADALGNPSYMAPECLRDEPITNCAADIWSVGVLVFLLMGGYPPFFNDNYNHFLKNIMEANYVFAQDLWGHVSPDGKEMIKILLHPDIDLRLTADELGTHKWFQSMTSSRIGSSLSSRLMFDKGYEETTIWAGQLRLKGFLRHLNDKKNKANHRKYTLEFKERKAFVPDENMITMPSDVTEVNFYQQKVTATSTTTSSILDVNNNNNNKSLVEIKQQSFHW